MNSSGYCFEPKWDGVRAIARVDGRVELFSRHANNLTPGFPEITGHLADALAGRTAILDGELVAVDRHARPSFGLIQRRMRSTRPSAHPSSPPCPRCSSFSTCCTSTVRT
ncbi:hypothetical protein [Mycobacterium sp. 1274761.0]|uniref:ATP-dependent DNA ligase n=1 Tax=Mycobacterium sp. 1274761.0 TaxID=1834077 RepID=UPI002101A53B|nr:hypothetical protein [Mycobacterium sp. 1274761.0]